MGRIRAKKSLGQHWLTDGRVLRRIADAADFTDDDTVVEIGCGKGQLTSLLAERASRLIGIEIDEDLVAAVRQRFAEAANVSIVSEDVMSITQGELLEAGGGRAPYVVVGNLPYNIGTALISRFLQATTRPRWLLVMLQAEVAESMAASAGKMSYLAAITQLFAEPRLLFYVPPKAFRPPPKVRSAVLRIDVRNEPLVPEEEIPAFIELAQAGFAAPRKRVRNSLAIGLRVDAAEAEALLTEAWIDPAVRPAEVGIDGWIALHRVRQKALARRSAFEIGPNPVGMAFTRTVAPAKINLTLEVLGKREDGYHEIRSVMQTIDLCDEVKARRAPELVRLNEASEALQAEQLKNVRPGENVLRMVVPPRTFSTSFGKDVKMKAEKVLGETVIRAVGLMDPGLKRDVVTDLRKAIPEAAGLGGGSSDGAAALRVLNQLWELGHDREALAEIGAQIGSDVPFFLCGGTALVSGRGEVVEPLPDARSTWVVVVTPPIEMEEKTKRMYGYLIEEDFSDGARTAEVAIRVRAGMPLRDVDLCNAFERAAYGAFVGLERYRDALIGAGAESAHVAGSGPSLFALAADQSSARGIAWRLEGLDAEVHVARFMSAGEATAVHE